MSETVPIATVVPGVVRAASMVLGVIAALTLASGVCVALAVASLAAFDPTLHGDWTLAVLLGLVGVGLAVLGAGVPLAGAFLLPGGGSGGRVVAGLVGAAMWLTPLFPVGMWLVYVVAGGDPLARVYFERRGTQG